MQSSGNLRAAKGSNSCLGAVHRGASTQYVFAGQRRVDDGSCICLAWCGCIVAGMYFGYYASAQCFDMNPSQVLEGLVLETKLRIQSKVKI